jgi:hypothetical protein
MTSPRTHESLVAAWPVAAGLPVFSGGKKVLA